MKHPTLTIVLNPEETDPVKQNTVTLRKWSAGQRTRVQSASMARVDVIAAQRIVSEGGTPEMLLDVGVKRLEMLKVCVVDWSGPIFEGEKVTPDAIEDLDDDVFDLIVPPCEAFLAGVSDDSKKPSGKPTSTE